VLRLRLNALAMCVVQIRHRMRRPYIEVSAVRSIKWTTFIWQCQIIVEKSRTR